MEVRDDPSNSMLIFTWGGRVFLMPRIPGDIPRFELPDYAAIQLFPPPRRFFRISLDHGDAPIYLEIVP